jgi:DNA-directed RNA polymerase specialized sigma24 family protein
MIATVCGARWTLAARRPERFTMIVFYRGLHCLVRRAYLAELERTLDEFTRRGEETAQTFRASRHGRGAFDEPVTVQEDEAIAVDRRIRLEAALRRLPDQQRAVVVLRILEGYSTKETHTSLRRTSQPSSGNLRPRGVLHCL